MTDPEPNQHLVIERSSGWAALRLEEVWQFRDLLTTLAQRDLKLRYRQTALGVGWVVLQPLLAAGVFSFVFGKVAGMKAPGEVPYFLFSFVGLLGWNLFSGTLTRSSLSLLGYGALLSKVFFPRLVLPLSTVISALVDFASAVLMLVVLMVVYRQPPLWQLALMPVWLGLLIAAALGIGLLASSLSVAYRDVQFILPVFMQILLYGSPVAYAVGSVPEQWRFWFYANPLVAPLEAFRWSILGTGEPPGWPIVYSTVVATVLLVFGAFSFKRMERRFADVI